MKGRIAGCDSDTTNGTVLTHGCDLRDTPDMLYRTSVRCEAK